MSSIEWIDKMPVTFRWILFLPAIGITYFLMRFFAAFSIGYVLGPQTDGLVSFLFYTFYYNCICVAVSLAISCLIIPKGRVIVALIYLGILLVLTGMGISNILNNAIYEKPLWRIIYESVATLAGYIYALVMILGHEKEMKKAPKGYSI